MNLLAPKSPTFYFTLNLYLVVATLAFLTLDYGLIFALYAGLGLTIVLLGVVLMLVFKAPLDTTTTEQAPHKQKSAA